MNIFPRFLKKLALLDSYAGWGATLRPRPTFDAKSRQKPPEGYRSPRRNKLRYTQYNQRLNCCTLRYCSLIEKIIGFFRRGEAAKSSRAVVLTIANRFELASTMHKAEPYCVPADLSFFQNTTVDINVRSLPSGAI